MIVDQFMTKSLTTSGTSAQFPTGVISDTGSAVDEWDLGLVGGSEALYLVLNITANTGTSPTMTPTLESDDNTGFSSALTVWTCPVQFTSSNTAGLFEFPLPKVRERYLRLSTGTIGGSASPGFTFTAYITSFATSGRL